MNIVDGISFQISSGYVAASSAFTGKEEIRVFVEGFKDVPFWNQLFCRCELSKKVKIIEASRDCKANGKDVIISMVRAGTLDLGQHLLIALDSDYDYLLDENIDLYKSDFCFQTYCYSIENFYYHPVESINICCSAANCFEFDHEFTCLSEIFANWSKSVYSQFLSFLSTKDSSQLEPIYQSLSSISIENNIVNCASDEVCPIFAQKGVSNDNLFLFIRGHNLEAKCIELFRNIVEQITQKKKEQINNNALHSEEAKRQLIAQFCRARSQIDTSLRSRDISLNPFFDKIISDINLFKVSFF